jgi:hypothetical protein
MKWLKPLLLVAALGHIVIGLYFLYAVEMAAPLVGFDLLTTGSRGELRRLAGGLVVALGAMILRGAVGGRFGAHLYGVSRGPRCQRRHGWLGRPHGLRRPLRGGAGGAIFLVRSRDGSTCCDRRRRARTGRLR